MAITRARAVLAAVVPLLLLSADAASAACVEQVCVTTPVSTSLLGDALTEFGQVQVAVDPLGTGDGGEGVLCLYVKHQAPPPPGWGGDPDSQPPYVWQQSQAWGFQHPYGYDFQACAPLCVAVDTDLLSTAETCLARQG